MENSNYHVGKPAFNKFLVWIVLDVLYCGIYAHFKLRNLNVKINKAYGKIPNKGAALIAAHHEEWIDQFVFKKNIRRRLNAIAASENFAKNLHIRTFLRKFLDKIGIIPIDIQNRKRNKGLFDYITYLLKIGEVVLICPEGNLRSERNNDRFGEAKDGVIRIAQFAQKKIGRKIPIYPVGLAYSRKSKLTEVYMRIGNPFYVNNKENSKKAMSNLMKEIVKLSNIKNG